MGVLRLALTATVGVLFAGAASAHVSLQPTSAVAGGYQVLRFGVGHGCDGHATTALRIEIPAGVSVARPQPKPGWRLSVETAPGRAETISAIVWKGRLAADRFDEFLILTKLPAVEGRLAFPAVQSCGATKTRWVEIANPNGVRPEHPAPSLTLSPAVSPHGGHEQHR